MKEPITHDHSTSLPHKLVFGSFQSDIHELINDVPTNGNYKCFQGSHFKRVSWNSIPSFMLWHILDQRKFGYSDEKIVDIWKI